MSPESAFLIGAVLLVGIALVIRHTDRRRKAESTETPEIETEGGRLFATVGLANQCPDCKGHGFYEGPSGGMLINIFCVNRECRSGFNITWVSQRQGICERIGKGDIRRYPNA